MDYKLEEKDSFRVIAKSQDFNMVTESEKIGLFWHEMMETYHDKFVELIDQANPKAFLGLYGNFQADTDRMTVWIGIQSDRETIEGFEVLEIPASTWAVFPVDGPSNQAIPEAWPKVFESLAKDGRKLSTLPSLEVYLAEDINDPNAYNEIWLPLA